MTNEKKKTFIAEKYKESEIEITNKYFFLQKPLSVFSYTVYFYTITLLMEEHSKNRFKLISTIDCDISEFIRWWWSVWGGDWCLMRGCHCVHFLTFTRRIKRRTSIFVSPRFNDFCSVEELFRDQFCVFFMYCIIFLTKEKNWALRCHRKEVFNTLDSKVKVRDYPTLKKAN